MKLIEAPKKIEAQGNRPKIIEEFIGRVNSSNDNVSIARMKSPEGWEESGQTPEFNEYTVVLNGKLKVETKNKTVVIEAGQAIIADKGEWVRYSTPFKGGAEYVAVCLPAFSPDTVHRD